MYSVDVDGEYIYSGEKRNVAQAMVKRTCDTADFAVCDKVMVEKDGLADNSIYRYGGQIIRNTYGAADKYAMQRRNT